MSGRKQHYIPKCLLKGFKIPRKERTKKSFVFVFKKGQRPFVSSTEDVAAERYFYSELSKDGLLTLDDRITKYENDLGKQLILLREAPLDCPFNPTIAAEVIAHLSMRAAHLRDVFSLGIEKLITGFAPIFINEGRVRALYGIDADEPPPLVKEQIEKILSEHAELFAILGLPKPVLIQVIFTFFKENFNRFYDDSSHVLMTILDSTACNANNIARDGHTKALTTTLKPDQRVTALSQLAWTIRAVPRGDLILPDCVALAMQNDSAKLVPYMTNNLDETNIVLLPIKADRILVGHRNSDRLPDLEGFNEAAAACLPHLLYQCLSNTRVGETDSKDWGAVQNHYIRCDKLCIK